ncbi:MAG: hypothetical protein AB4352_12940 [Hormoscilla sp.]
MKSTIGSLAIVAITILTLAATAPLSRSDAIINSETLENKQLQNMQYQISAVDLVNRAYRGALKDQGIPSYQTLSLYYKRRTITAKDVVAAAVKANLIEAAAVDDRNYLSVVDAQLKALEDLGR